MLDKLAQTNDVLNNLMDSEAKFQELNQRLDSVKMEYEMVMHDNTTMSFFNFDNIYFWFLVCGLFILAFALWFLWLEFRSEKTTKIKKIKKVKEKKQKIVRQQVEEKNILEPIKKSENKAVYKVKVHKNK